jgi:enamine deaminase RidA (YjgF/YER057c/UK114 family)
VTRLLVSSGGRFEGPFGYSRAVVVDDGCWVAGTTDPGDDHTGDPAGQARAALAIIERALGDAVRTRLYVTDPAYAEPVARVHGEVFGEIRPASTLVVVSALLEPRMLVEIEAEARRGGWRG